MFLLDDIVYIKNNNYQDKERIYKLYRENIGLISNMAYGMSSSYLIHQDYMQIAYIALEESLRKYDMDSEYSFLSYFRRCFLHEMYQFNLHFKYPFCLNEYQRKLILENNLKIIIESLDSAISYPDMSDEFYYIEQKIIRIQVFKECKRLLNNQELLYIIYRFYKNNTRSHVARKLNSSYSKIRSFEISILQKLRRSFILKSIAQDYFDIKVFH